MSPPRIAVLIATLDRAEGLKALLGAISRLRREPGSDGSVVIVVVDNSETATARAVCDDQTGGRFDLIYVHEPRRGLSFARNAGLETALEAGATHVAFIDDDEMPEPGWLHALMSTLEDTGATAAIGPVQPIFEGMPPSWSVETAAFAKSNEAPGAPLLDGYTSNAIVDLGFVARHGLRFASRYNFTGGEDTMFFRDLRAKGGTIAWAPAALVHETVPAARASRRWLLRRWFRTGGTEADLAGLDRRGAPRHVHNVSRGCARLVGGFVVLLVGLARHPGRPGGSLAGLRTMCRGAGLVWSAAGRTFAEYGTVAKPPVLR